MVFTVVIPAFDARATIAGCLSALARERARASGDHAWEVLVVDDASRDGTAEVAARALPEARVLRLERNVGADGARNAALERARPDTDAYVFLDADCAVLPGWGAALAGALARGAPIAMGRVVPPPDALQRALALLELGEFIAPGDRALANFATLNLALRADLIRGRGFDAGARTCGDRLFSWRLYREGVPIRFVSDMAALHAPELGSLARVLARRRRYAEAFLEVRRRDPTIPGARLIAPGPLAAPFAAAARLVRDLSRLAAARGSLGVSRAALPLYGLALAALRALDAALLVEAALDGRGGGGGRPGGGRGR